MKTSYLILTIFLILAGCNSDDVDYATINGSVQRAVNGEGIAGQSVRVMTRKNIGSGMFGTIRELDRKDIITDENGNFSVALINEANAYATIAYEGDDDYFGSGSYRDYAIDEPIIIEADKYIKFKILVKNTNPVDENDFIRIDFYAGLSSVKRTGIENFGIENTVYPADGNAGSWEEASWTGTNVNSIVYYSVPETAEHFKIRWYMKKGGVETDGFTNDIPHNINEINSFPFDY